MNRTEEEKLGLQTRVPDDLPTVSKAISPANANNRADGTNEYPDSALGLAIQETSHAEDEESNEVALSGDVE